MANENNNQLLIAVLSQIQITKINYQTLAKDIGAPGPDAARMRWQRFYKKLKKPNSSIPSQPVGIQKSTPSPTKDKRHKAVKFEDEEEESIGHSNEPVTPPPPRRMPSRKARVTSFKEMIEYEGLSEDELDGRKLDDGEAENGLEWDGFEE